MTQLLQNAAYGAVLILAAALLRQVLKDRLMPGARLALWAVCLFRLLTPAPPESVLSLWGLFASFAPVSQPSGPAYDTMSYLPPAAEAFVPQIAEPGTSPDLYLKPAPFPWEKVLPAVWLIVGAALAAWYVLSWIRTRRAVACATPVDGRDPRYASLPKCARLREGPMEGAPLTFGVVRPTVVLSPGLEGDALDCVLAHEGVHARRRDNLWHYVMAIALIVHWWNPAVWLMARLLRRDIELSCDRAALKKLGADRRTEYANALVSMATRDDGPAFCQTFGRKAAEERILSVMKFKKTSVIGVILSLALVLAVTAAFASEPKTPTDTVVYHGQTYNRADLSQETLDWLDWYLSLPEESQMAVSMVPPELIAGLEMGTNDADASEAVTAVEPTSPVTPTADGLVPAIGTKGEEGYVRQSDLDGPGGNVKNPEEAQAYMEWLATQPAERLIPLYDAKGNVIGQFAVGNPAKISAAPDDGKTISDYDVKLPTFDEDGNSVTGILGEQFYSYDSVSSSDIAVGSDPVPVPSDEPAKAFDDYTIVGMDENGYPVDEQGNSLVFDDNGNLFMKVRSGYGPCIKTDCTVSGEHYHANGEVIPFPQSNAPTPVVTPEVGAVPLADPCPVDGCTIQGEHTHNGVTYACSGAHSGGICDGSCNTYNDVPEYVPSSTSGHHGESHHGNGHH